MSVYVVKMLNVSILRVTTSVSVTQGLLEMDTIAQVCLIPLLLKTYYEVT